MPQEPEIKTFFDDRDKDPRNHTCTIEIPEANKQGNISIKIQNSRLETGLKPVTVTVNGSKELAERVKNRLKSHGFKRVDSDDPNTWEMVFSNRADLNRMLGALAVQGESSELTGRPIITPVKSHIAVAIAETVFPKAPLSSVESWQKSVTADILDNSQRTR